MEFSVHSGFCEDQRGEAARLFWQAFSGKLGKVLAPEGKALALIEDTLDPGFAISAVSPDGKLLGLAGFKTREGALTGGNLRDVIRHYGYAGGIWRGLLLQVLERDPEPDQLLMDGIFVRTDARGLGIGTALLNAICDKAQAKGLSRVRLDVIDTNPNAKKLYERFGFESVGTEETGPFKALFGFSSATRMEKTVLPA